jgi:phenylpropionate dioxygenase-like ring-hydroxylating dioxygenase large terminal subunit
MIPNQWYVLLDSHEVKRNKTLGVRRLGENLVLWQNSAGEVASLRDQYLHRGAALSAGRVIDWHIQCPFHELEFDASGRCTYIPAYGRYNPIPKVFQTRSYPARDAFGFIWIWWGELQDEFLYRPVS